MDYGKVQVPEPLATWLHVGTSVPYMRQPSTGTGRYAHVMRSRYESCPLQLHLEPGPCTRTARCAFETALRSITVHSVLNPPPSLILRRKDIETGPPPSLRPRMSRGGHWSTLPDRGSVAPAWTPGVPSSRAAGTLPTYMYPTSSYRSTSGAGRVPISSLSQALQELMTRRWPQ